MQGTMYPLSSHVDGMELAAVAWAAADAAVGAAAVTAAYVAVSPAAPAMAVAMAMEARTAACAEAAEAGAAHRHSAGCPSPWSHAEGFEKAVGSVGCPLLAEHPQSFEYPEDRPALPGWEGVVPVHKHNQHCLVR